LGEGIFTQSKRPWGQESPEYKWQILEPFIPKDLKGKTVLDLGGSSGYLAMKMKKRGASKVVAVDFSNDALKQTTFISKWFNVDLEIVEEEAHVYCLTTDEQFDYIFCLNLFYHLKYGVLVLDRLAEMTKQRLYFQSSTVGPLIEKYEPKENYLVDDSDSMNSSEEFPKLLFIEKKYQNDVTNWWLPNDAALISLLRSAKLKIVSRPARQVFVCEPNEPYGKKSYKKCVFPQYGKDLKDNYYFSNKKSYIAP